MQNLILNIETTLTNESLLNCISFWNREGATIYKKNQEGKLGKPENQKEARETRFDLWLLEMIASDCNTVFNKSEGFDFGRSGSHVWINLNGKRVALITVIEKEVEPVIEETTESNDEPSNEGGFPYTSEILNDKQRADIFGRYDVTSIVCNYANYGNVSHVARITDGEMRAFLIELNISGVISCTEIVKGQTLLVISPESETHEIELDKSFDGSSELTEQEALELIVGDVFFCAPLGRAVIISSVISGENTLFSVIGGEGEIFVSRDFSAMHAEHVVALSGSYDDALLVHTFLGRSFNRVPLYDGGVRFRSYYSQDDQKSGSLEINMRQIKAAFSGFAKIENDGGVLVISFDAQQAPIVEPKTETVSPEQDVPELTEKEVDLLFAINELALLASGDGTSIGVKVDDDALEATIARKYGDKAASVISSNFYGLYERGFVLDYADGNKGSSSITSEGFFTLAAQTSISASLELTDEGREVLAALKDVSDKTGGVYTEPTLAPFEAATLALIVGLAGSVFPFANGYALVNVSDQTLGAMLDLEPQMLGEALLHLEKRGFVGNGDEQGSRAFTHITQAGLDVLGQYAEENRK